MHNAVENPLIHTLELPEYAVYEVYPAVIENIQSWTSPPRAGFPPTPSIVWGRVKSWTTPVKPADTIIFVFQNLKNERET
jgi:hypothetical protein